MPASIAANGAIKTSPSRRAKITFQSRPVVAEPATKTVLAAAATRNSGALTMLITVFGEAQDVNKRIGVEIGH